MIKRTIDVFISAGVIIFCLPLIVLILFLVFIITGENPVLLQERKISLDNNGIKIIKIRTIKSSNKFLKLDKSSEGIYIKKDYEKYVPLFCKWLRKTGLDEILQVINVLKGEMSFVGPRPLLESDLLIMRLADPYFYNRRKSINSKPGITGCWQVYGDRLKGTENLIQLDEIYEKERSVRLDFKIILRTVMVFMTASHSDAIVAENSKKMKNSILGKILLPE